jgi:hypothetical protein
VRTDQWFPVAFGSGSEIETSESNKLKEFVDKLAADSTKNMNGTRIDASNAIRDFPVLTLDQLNEITVGWFHLKQAKRYAMEHLSDNESFTVQRANIGRVRIQSRHRNAVLYNLYIQ